MNDRYYKSGLFHHVIYIYMFTYIVWTFREDSLIDFLKDNLNHNPIYICNENWNYIWTTFELHLNFFHMQWWKHNSTASLLEDTLCWTGPL